MSWGDINRRKGILNERKVLRAIKSFPKEDEYFVVTYKAISDKTGLSEGAVRGAVKRLEKKGLVEIKTSFAMFGSMLKKGIHVLEEANESLA